MIDNIIVITLNRKRLKAELMARDMNLSRFAKACGISRQSLYDMFRGSSIFSVPFGKILNYTGISFDEIISVGSGFESVIRDAPEGVRKAVFALQKFAEARGADLFLIGSRARGKKGLRADWDFAVYLAGVNQRRSLVLLKQRMEDLAFPHRIDLVDLNSAPAWFLRSIESEAIKIFGEKKIKDIVKEICVIRGVKEVI